jgi:hypothetical protein
VLRDVLLSLVFLVAAGPVAKTLCPVWCHFASTSSAVVCEHGMPATPTIGLTGDDACDMGVTTVCSDTEDTRRLVPSTERHLAIVMTPMPFAGASTLPFRSICASSPPLAQSGHARSTVLRI